MAKILYGVHGTGHGHAMRALTIARAMPRHEFLFVCDDDAPKVLAPEFRVERIPNLGTRFKNYRVDLAATIAHAVPLLARRRKYVRRALDIIEDFRPDICMTDLEYFVPRAAKLAGVPCLSLDHQHIVTSCRHSLPPELLFDAFLQGLTPRYLFSPTEANLIISFYAPPVRGGLNARVAPPILRRQVLELEASDAGHILVYQSNSTSGALLDLLRAGSRTAYVYGFGRDSGRDGNIVFMRKSEEQFLELLAASAYVVMGGSHTLMSEALFLGKPVLSLPLEGMIEQRLNTLYLDRLGYGREARMGRLSPGLLRAFEDDLPHFRARSAQCRGNFCGNELVYGLIDRFIADGALQLA